MEFTLNLSTFHTVQQSKISSAYIQSKYVILSLYLKYLKIMMTHVNDDSCKH